MRKYLSLLALVIGALVVTEFTSEVLYAWQTGGQDDDQVPAAAGFAVPRQQAPAKVRARVPPVEVNQLSFRPT
jgi:hypothetical protein